MSDPMPFDVNDCMSDMNDNRHEMLIKSSKMYINASLLCIKHDLPFSEQEIIDLSKSLCRLMIEKEITSEQADFLSKFFTDNMVKE